MITKIYSVHDAKSEAYLPTFAARTNGEAVRSFTAALDDPQSQFHKYASDYTLFELGSFDDSTGVVTPLVPILALGNGVDFKNNQ